METTIQKGDKIRIKENLMEELVKHGFNELEQKGFVERFKGKIQTAIDVYKDEDNGTEATWVTVEMCCEIPLTACEKLLSTEELKELWGEELFNVFADQIDTEGFLTNDWADILEKKYPDHTFYDQPEIKENIYSRMYNIDTEENCDGTRHRPIK